MHTTVDAFHSVVRFYCFPHTLTVAHTLQLEHVRASMGAVFMPCASLATKPFRFRNALVQGYIAMCFIGCEVTFLLFFTHRASSQWREWWT